MKLAQQILLGAAGAIIAAARADTACVADDQGLLQGNVKTVSVTADFRLNGAAFPADAANAARVYLAKDGLLQVDLGDTDQPVLPRHVLADSYDLVYEHKAGALVPQNRLAVFAEDVPVTSSGTLIVNVPAVVQAGDFVLDGGPFPASEFEDARIHAKRADGNDEVLLGNTHDGGYSVTLLPGAYDILYARESGGGIVPWNSHAIVDTRDIVGNDFAADVVVTSASLSGEFRFNGALAPDTPYENGAIVLRRSGGDEIPLGQTRDQGYSIRLIPGAYDIHWELLVSNGTAPQNPEFRLLQAVALGGGNFDIDVPSRTVVGDFTINGAAPPATVYSNGQVSLKDRQIGAETVLGQTQEQAYSTRLIPGSYDVVYRLLLSTGGAPVPLNAYSAVKRVAVPAGGLIQVELDIDIPMTTLELDASLDGAGWPKAGPSLGELVLFNPDGSLGLALGTTQALPFSGPVVSGFYRLGYSHLGGVEAPLNEQFRWPGLSDVQGALTALEFPFHSMLLESGLTLNGGSWPASPDQSGRLLLVRGTEFLELGPTHAPAARRALQGTYTMKYAHDEGLDVPLNFLQSLACFHAETGLFSDGFE